MPGSRYHEIAAILPVMMDAKRLISKKHPDITWHLPVARGLDASRIGHMADPEVRLVDPPARGGSGHGEIRDILLEMALRGVPEVVCYRTSPINYLLAKTWVKVEHIAMPNIISGRAIVPELIQHHFRGRNWQGR
jgi:lipid-A-disaccharide synthase